jgi:peptide/nickel transport system ATP-binding protein
VNTTGNPGVEVIAAMSHRIAVMQNGAIIEQGAAEEKINAPQHDYTRQLLPTVFARD